MSSCENETPLVSACEKGGNAADKQKLIQETYFHLPQRSNMQNRTRLNKIQCAALLLLCSAIIALVIFFVQHQTFLGSNKFIRDEIKMYFEGDRGLDTIFENGLWERILKRLKSYEEDTQKKDEVSDESWKKPPFVTPWSSCCDVADNDKFDCDPEGTINRETCFSRGCCWRPLQNLSNFSRSSPNFPPLNVPYCYFPSNYVGYNVTQKIETASEIIAILKRVRPSGYSMDIDTVKVEIKFFFLYIRIKMTDANGRRFEVPKKLFNVNYDKDNPAGENKGYDVQLKDNGELIIRRSSNDQEAIFHTDLSRLVYSDQFLQLSSRLPSKYIYGLGVHKGPLLRDVNWKRYTFFNRDRAPTEDVSLYGSHPFYLAMEKSGSSHGVFLLNSNAMDIILQPTPAITYRTIGGILDFFVFLGPNPIAVVSQYFDVIGKPFLPPYWSLGFHLCKYNYGSLNNTKAAWKRTREANIPLDAQWNDIDVMMNNNDFTYDNNTYEGLPDFVKELHDSGMHYLTIVDAGISSGEPNGTYPPYDDGVKMNIFIKNSTGNIFVGKVWNKKSTVFPDFTNPLAAKYWTRQLERYHDEVPIDGAWIDMNEPSNFYNGQIDGCPDSNIENPAYVPGGIEHLRTKTLCMSAKHYDDLHYNIHNLHALTEAIITNQALKEIRKKRPFVLSRASFPGIGSYAGVWSGDMFSTWDSMRWSIPSLLNMNMFGITLTGSDICGFNGNTTVELCARWSSLGAFYPFSRNHNSDGAIEQDPVILGPVVTRAARNALTTRYYLLPYIYTLFSSGYETVARPLFFQYPRDNNTYAIDRQFLLGSALMVLPALDPNVTTVTAYFPKTVWYDFYTGRRYKNTGGYIVLDAPLDKINLAVRGGSIIPAQTPGLTTTESRLNNFTLIIAPGEDGRANGDLYWDDGESIDTSITGDYFYMYFYHYANKVITEDYFGKYINIPLLDTIVVFGCTSEPKTATINNRPVPFSYNSTNKVLTILELNASLLRYNSIEWE